MAQNISIILEVMLFQNKQFSSKYEPKKIIEFIFTSNPCDQKLLQLASN